MGSSVLQIYSKNKLTRFTGCNVRIKLRVYHNYVSEINKIIFFKGVLFLIINYKTQKSNKHELNKHNLYEANQTQHEL